MTIVWKELNKVTRISLIDILFDCIEKISKYHQRLEENKEVVEDTFRADMLLVVFQSFSYLNIFNSEWMDIISKLFEDFNSLEIHKGNLSQARKEYDEKISKFSVKNHDLKESKSVYAWILYTLIKNMVKHNLNHPENPPGTVKQFTQDIDTLIKNFYNSRSIYPDQK